MKSSRAIALAAQRKLLEEGEHLVAKRAFMGAVNRFYYAAFYTARCLLALREVDSSRHSGVIALFQKEFVRIGLFTTDIAKALPRAFEKRQKSDYGDFSTVTRKKAQTIRGEVSKFIDECEQVLARLLAEE